MPSTRARSVVIWGLAIAVIVVLAAVAGGVALRGVYRTSATGSQLPPPGQQQPPGSGVVEFTPGAAAHPAHNVVRSLLQRHFDSINLKQYAVWKTTAVRARVRDMPSTTWHRAYRSTRDGTILVHRIDAGGDDALRVLLSFTSVQDPADAPANMPVPCLHWRAVYELVDDGSGLKVDTGLPGSTLAAPC